MTSPELETKKLDAIWSNEAKDTLRRMYDIWNDIENKKAELKSEVKQLEYKLDQNMTELGLTDKFVKGMICTIICRRIEKDGKDEELRMFVVNHVEKELLLTQREQYRYKSYL